MKKYRNCTCITTTGGTNRLFFSFNSMSNNNKRKNDGRTNNHRRDRVKMIKADPSLPAARSTPAKKSRAKKLSNKAIKNIFGSEDGIWDKLAEQALSGNMKAMEMLLQYQYGKAGESQAQAPTKKQAPIIQFVNPLQQPAQVDNTIDITHEEDEQD